MRPPPRSASLLRLLALCLLSPLCSQATGDKPSQVRTRTHYKGREIATTMHYLGAPWLIRESREREEECSKLIGALGIRPGDVVCDFGCGNGFYTLEIAKRVGEKGKVLAVDIQKQMLGLLRLRAKKTDVGGRIQTIHNSIADTGLAPNSVDLVLLVDVYHELSTPERTLRQLAGALRPGGRIALAEFREEDPEVPIKPLHKMSKRQILREWIPNGFRLVDSFEELPWQHLMIFGRGATGPAAKAARDRLAELTKGARGLAVRGGFAGIYSRDLTRSYGEAMRQPATSTQAFVQPPGTPTVGAAFLRAFRLTGSRATFAAARGAGRALAWGQTRSGGWPSLVDLNHLIPGARRPERRGVGGTFDDNTSQAALAYLIELEDLVAEPWLRESIELGLKFLLDGQFENGAWPQRLPLKGGYQDLYTFNDGAINDCVRVALLAFDRYGRKNCMAAAQAAGAFIVKTQGKAPQAGWAQQYDTELRPAKARAFEPAALCTAVTARNIQTLLDLHLRTGEEKFATAAQRAAAWLRTTRGEDGKWPRLVEIGTDRPIYGDRDGEVRYDLSEVSDERRAGYGWRGRFGIPAALAACAAHAESGAEGLRAFLRQREEARARTAARSAQARADAIAETIDADGRIPRDNHYHIADLVRALHTLCDVLDGPPR